MRGLWGVALALALGGLVLGCDLEDEPTPGGEPAPVALDGDSGADVNRDALMVRDEGPSDVGPDRVADADADRP